MLTVEDRAQHETKPLSNQITQIIWVFSNMATILIKNVPEEVLKELKRLKVELGCKTWADLLERLAISCEVPLVTEEERERMKKGYEGLMKLREQVSAKWKEPPGVVEEIRRTRRHENT